MKRMLLFVALVLMGHVLFAQNSIRLTVRNQTSCVMYYRILASGPVVPGGSSCTVGVASAVVSIPPGGLISYSALSLPGVGAPPPGMSRVILGAQVYSGPSGCDMPFQLVSSYACLGWPPVITVNANDPGCLPCGTVVGTWAFPGAQNTLDFM